ncbi:MAG: carbohydrate ABC transporter permease [Aristaeellaceae bacterium]
MLVPSAKPGKRRIRIRRPSFSQLMLYLFLGAMVVFCALPLFAMVCRALMPLDELYLYPPRLIVRKPTLRNFSDLLTSLSSSTVPFTRYIFNSLFTTVITVTVSILVCCLGAYGLVKHKPAGANVIFAIVVAALSFSTHVTTIPNYLVVNRLGLVNTYWALIIPKIALAFNFFLVKQFCEQLPDSILEAARIDGARELHIFWTIAMPLLKPAWTTLAVFSFVNNWNDYFSPLIFIQSNALKTLPLALQTLQGGAGVVARAGTVGAATFLTTLPSILVFALMRGKVMETMSFSGIKS